jgi:hypothetical protein
MSIDSRISVPCLAINPTSGTIILVTGIHFTTDKKSLSGVVVKRDLSDAPPIPSGMPPALTHMAEQLVADLSQSEGVGHYSEDFDAEKFVRYDGQITLDFTAKEMPEHA